ncbi:NADH-quinone oxidoreductase subunit L [Stieleria maiorica]|uniref:NADH-quinone oxidoreductase subunit L n=1 Tax=Stieleria maiorica TaxID=2795974 RepID=A0A5B9MLV2_9BACT|nr:NADH-quinone oxidoreductase subunit L [Stieleria maiorica]QEG01974.1 NADH-quinone oxidoreductase subunit L [Stieleria maiorica]
MTGFIFENAWMIPALPLISIVLIVMFARGENRAVAGIIGSAAIGLAFLLTCWLGVSYLRWAGQGAGAVTWSIEWLRYQDHLVVSLGTLIDPISLLLLVVVTSVSLLVHVYSLGYMADDEGFARYYVFLSLFTFSMLGLVLAPNLVQMYVFWELVGVSSFLLIGFYYTLPEAIAASKKAFIVTRFADLFFLAGILVLGFYVHQFVVAGQSGGETAAQTQALDFATINADGVLLALKGQPGILGADLLTVAMLLVFVGAAGKSAMFPLHVWLPDAMAGPTPVSALIHAATMVVAGVYLVARMFPGFAASEDALRVVAAVGCFTCLFAAVIACTQTDIKRVLAFSTLSQIGYMTLALGVASAEHPAGFGAAMFHLYTHAFFKALLFLGAGSVIHAVHSNEVTDMGGLRKSMPWTHGTFLAATLAIAGVPPLAGFFSKDEILGAAWDGHHSLVFGVGVFVASLTAFYMFRLYILTFLGGCRSGAAERAHESPAVMTIPLVVLSVMSLCGGLVGVSQFVLPGVELHAHLAVMGISVAAAAVGIGAAFWLYGGQLYGGWLYGGGQTNHAETIARSLGGVYRLVKNKFYIDEVYLFLTRMIFRFVAAPAAWFDRHVVDGAMNLSAGVVRWFAVRMNGFQTGQVQTYGIWMINGTILVVVFLWLVQQ